MKLNISEKSNLILTVADLIKSAHVLPSGRISFENIRKKREEVRSRISEDIDARVSEICGEFGLIDFIRYSLNREILSLKNRPKRGELAALPDYKDSLEVARRLVSELEKLPQKLRIISPLPSSLSGFLFNGIGEKHIGDGVAVISSNIMIPMIDFEMGNERLRENIVRNIDIDKFPKRGTHYFCTWHSGFAGNFIGNASIQEHQDRIRAFYGCLLSLDIVGEDFFFDELDQPTIICSDVSSDAVCPTVLCDTADSDLKFFYENFDAKMDYYKSPLLNGEQEEDGEEVDGKEWEELSEEEDSVRNEIIDHLKTLFEKGDHSRKMYTSALWLFRSFVSTRPLDIILEATIALEVLLGDREAAASVGLTKLLANRCAYLLGGTAEARTKLMEDFKHIYEIRSGIVHSGLHQMGTKASEASVLSRSLASRVLSKELNLAK